MKIESEQRCLFEQVIKDSPVLEENSVVSAITESYIYFKQVSKILCLQVFDRLDEYIIEDSPVKGVCLVFGASGSGKSTTIANWYVWYAHFYMCTKYVNYFLFFRIKKVSNSADILVFHHFVKIMGSSSSEACCVYRRFIQQVIMCNLVHLFLYASFFSFYDRITEYLDLNSYYLCKRKRTFFCYYIVDFCTFYTFVSVEQPLMVVINKLLLCNFEAKKYSSCHAYCYFYLKYVVVMYIVM